MQALKRTYLIDIGNSALKWAEATTPQNTGVITYGDMVMLAEQVRDFYRHQRPELIYACTVAHSVIASTVQQVCERTRIELLGSQREFNGAFHVVNRYDDYTKLGPDRWYAALGAVSKHPDENLLIVQMGTALTADSIICRGEGEYEYLGGRIAPGPTMMFKSLQQGTSMCRAVRIRRSLRIRAMGFPPGSRTVFAVLFPADLKRWERRRNRSSLLPEAPLTIMRKPSSGISRAI